MSRPTIDQIAAAAGVSKATVSRALRGEKGQSEATRRRIVALAHELGYTPHPLISALMTDLRLRRPTSYSPVLALVHRPPHKGFRARNLTVLRESLHAHVATMGYTVTDFYLGEDDLSPQRLQGILHARGIRGVVFEQIFSQTTHEGLDLSELAGVTVGSTAGTTDLHRVAVDQFTNVVTAVEAVQRRGYRRIGLVVPKRTEDLARFKRETALIQALGHEGKSEILETFAVGIHFERQARSFARWLERQQPDVVLSNVVGLPAMLGRLGLRMPQDIGFVHLGWHPEDAGVHAGVNPNWDVVASTAGNLIIDQINRNQVGLLPTPLLTLVRGAWVEGPSVRPARRRPVRAAPGS